VFLRGAGHALRQFTVIIRQDGALIQLPARKKAQGGAVVFLAAGRGMGRFYYCR